VAAETLAVLRFTGDRRRTAVIARTGELLNTLHDKKLRPKGEPVAWFCDPPWTVPWLRRNEVAVPIAG
jgi:hypothetical protein